ncbi:hypothetical protein JCM19231_4286 [Vibrio ishigakensis]|uniref:Uncharacterized protein n=1 Tax=Vibrio ishigakensis TaxID=1481914 RepID=A0A0B8P896_9VIBR|nr:hypothetical protein JCM19231_4286 [Vibrio ishigakensis]
MMPELPYISGVEASGIVADANGTGLKKVLRLLSLVLLVLQPTHNLLL